MVWWWVAKVALALVVSYVITPRPRRPQAPAQRTPDAAKAFDVAGSEDGKPISVVFGRRRITNGNVVWYGDFSARPITETTEY